MGEHASNTQHGREGQADAENLSASLAELVSFLFSETQSQQSRWRITEENRLKTSTLSI